MCVCFQIDLRDDPKTLARLLYMKEKPLTYEHGVKLARAVTVTFTVNFEQPLADNFSFCFASLNVGCASMHLASSYCPWVPSSRSQASWRSYLVGILTSQHCLFSIKKKPW